ncbi:MAG: hypothetical protein ABJC09_06780 [Terriglobia bacterium]
MKTWLVVAAELVVCGVIGLRADSPAADGFRTTVRPFVEKSCFPCHNAKLNTGGLNLEDYTTADSVTKDRDK